MRKKRKIALEVRKVSFKETEELDDKYWAKRSNEERLQSLIELRQIVFANNAGNGKMKKVIDDFGFASLRLTER